eukprot:CAMPEP_0115841360 /NCGR_PEP_ID=MMETSP0287-20121206/7248_1 /TAXON_ID=412157 /ORGANISM="Chrysochromulina rotalis, Strain UIO044" /LENGTH=113 /DNA_ID=CAMNT_0003295003 /DNA_START=602 /DNA_END=944 /DNA_ORIENTATION=-
MCLCLHSASEKRVLERSGSGKDEPTSTMHVSLAFARKRSHPEISPSLEPVANMLTIILHQSEDERAHVETRSRSRTQAHADGMAVLPAGWRPPHLLVWQELMGTAAVVQTARA